MSECVAIGVWRTFEEGVFEGESEWFWWVSVSERGQIWVSESKWESDKIGCVRRSLGLKAWEWQAWEWQAWGWRVFEVLFGFFFHHLSPLTQFLSLITHHLKYPNFLYLTCLAFLASLHSIFSTFCGTHAYKLVRTLLLSLPLKTHSPPFSALLISFCHHHGHNAKVQPK